MSTTSLGDALTVKLGPLPAWGWAGIIAGGAITLRLVRGRTQAAAPAPSTDDQADTVPASAVPVAGAASTGAAASYQPTTAPVGSSYSTTSTTGPQTMDEWQAAAFAAVRTDYDPATAASAIAKYLASQPLTSAEQAIVSAALRAAGIPPGGALPIVTASTSAGTGSTTAPPVPVTPPPADPYAEYRNATSTTSWWYTPEGGYWEAHAYQTADPHSAGPAAYRAHWEDGRWLTWTVYSAAEYARRKGIPTPGTGGPVEGP